MKKEVPADKPSRSDIDFRIDSGHPQAKDLIDDLKKVGDNAGTAGKEWSTNPEMPRGRPTEAPFIRITPDGAVIWQTAPVPPAGG